MKSAFFRPLGIAALAFVSLTACKRTAEVPEDTHEHDGFTKVSLLVSQAGSTATPQVYTWTNGQPTGGEITLKAGNQYTSELRFYNAEGTDVTSEIVEEKEQHFVVYEAGSGLTMKRNANDVTRVNGQKIGLKTTWTATASATPLNLRMNLYHSPLSVNMNYPTENDQKGSVTGGEVDVTVNYTVKVTP